MAEKAHLKILINLARIDGEISEEEFSYLLNIAKANNIGKDELLSMLNSDQEETVKSTMNEDERLNLLVQLVQLMKCDGKLYKEEIRYCSKIASRLGYKEETLFDLMLNIKSGSAKVENIDDLKKATKTL